MSESLTFEELKKYDLVCEFNGVFKYKFSFDGRFYCANSKKDAILEANKTFFKTPKENRIIKEMAWDISYNQKKAKVKKQYSFLSREQICQKIKSIEKKLAILNKNNNWQNYGTMRKSYISQELIALSEELNNLNLCLK